MPKVTRRAVYQSPGTNSEGVQGNNKSILATIRLLLYIREGGGSTQRDLSFYISLTSLLSTAAKRKSKIA